MMQLLMLHLRQMLLPPNFPKPATLIINLEKKMTSRFDGLDIELLKLKDVIIKNLQVENECLRKTVNVLENKVLTLESEHIS